MGYSKAYDVTKINLQCVLKNFEKFTEKQLCWSLIFNNKVTGDRPPTLLNKEL